MPEFGPVTCAGCALLCDDVTVEISQGIRMRPDCPLGARWFSERMALAAAAPAAMIDGRPADVESAIGHAATLLRDARRPLLHGFDHATVEDVRAAVALADRLGALVVNGARGGVWPGAPAVPLRGASTATLGEVRERSRVVVIWREDPETTHPRLLERLGFGSDAPDRTLVLVDDRDTATAGRADVRLTWPRERDLEALVGLHMLARGLELRSDDLTGELTGLADRVRAVPHATFVHGAGVSGAVGGQRRALALHELVRALCQERHVVTLELPGAPGTRSADDVLAWQSGYGGDVDFAAGHPEPVTAIQPPDDVDVTLVVESARAGILVAARGAEVWIRTAPAGVEASGTAHRLDGVPLTLQAPIPGRAPTAAALLGRILSEVGR